MQLQIFVKSFQKLGASLVHGMSMW